jgi:hypothetical protein
MSTPMNSVMNLNEYSRKHTHPAFTIYDALLFAIRACPAAHLPPPRRDPARNNEYQDLPLDTCLFENDSDDMSMDADMSTNDNAQVVSPYPKRPRHL